MKGWGVEKQDLLNSNNVFEICLVNSETQFFQSLLVTLNLFEWKIKLEKSVLRTSTRAQLKSKINEMADASVSR